MVYSLSFSRKCFMRVDRSGRLTILSETEKQALYGLPDFDDFQRFEFFAMTETERSLAFRRSGFLAQVYCLLQTGYFKAKQAFFRFSLNDVPPEDIAFLLQRYFPGQAPTMQPLPAKEYYAQRKEIAAFFGYRLWSDEDLPTLLDRATLLARMDVTPTFLLTELMAFLISRRSPIKTKLIQQQLAEVLRLAESIQQGTVTASLILRKLGSYPRQNSLAIALREIGRVERTLFMLEWIENPALRRRVSAGLNKGEARNSLARRILQPARGNSRPLL